MRTAEGLLFLDRTRNAYDLKCRRRRFLAFEWHRRGISPRQRGLALEMGSIIHDSFALLLETGEVDAVCAAAVKRYRDGVADGSVAGGTDQRLNENIYLLEGMLRGWHRLVLPRVLAEYEVVLVEGEVAYDFLGCRLGAKPDVLLRRRSDGTLWYVEWKTTSTLSLEYFASWTKAVQLHAGALGVARSLGEEIAGAVVFCIYKGFYSKTKQRQESIFCYGYVPRSGDSSASDVSFSYKAGLVKAPLWDFGITSKKWLAEMPQEVLEEQFGDTGPVFLDERLCEAWLRQTALREAEIANAVDLLELTEKPEAREEIMDRYFQQNFDECLPAWGFKCDWHDVCHVKSVGDDPLKHGMFVWRQPHHSTDPVMEG